MASTTPTTKTPTLTTKQSGPEPEPKWLTVTELSSLSEALFGMNLHKVRSGAGTFATWANSKGVEKRPFNFHHLTHLEQVARAARVATDSCFQPPASVLKRCKFEYSVSSIREVLLALKQRRLHEAGDTQPLHEGLTKRRRGPRWMVASQIGLQFALQLSLLTDKTSATSVSTWLGSQVRQGTIRRREIDWTSTEVQKRYGVQRRPAHGSRGSRARELPPRTKYEYNVSDLQKQLRKIVARQQLAKQELATRATRVTTVVN